jgi:hypothetical protein
MDLATSRRDDRAHKETELAVVGESGLSSQRTTEPFGNEQRRLKPDSGCFGGLPGRMNLSAPLPYRQDLEPLARDNGVIADLRIAG